MCHTVHLYYPLAFTYSKGIPGAHEGPWDDGDGDARTFVPNDDGGDYRILNVPLLLPTFDGGHPTLPPRGL